MAANDTANSCGANLSLLDLVAASMGEEASGKAYFRTHKVTAVAGSKAFDCGGSITEDDIKSKIADLFCLDANGDIALRVTQTT